MDTILIISDSQKRLKVLSQEKAGEARKIVAKLCRNFKTALKEASKPGEGVLIVDEQASYFPALIISLSRC